VNVFFTEDKQIVRALRYVQFAAFDAGEWLERGTRRTAAVRAMAVQRIGKFVSDRVLDRTAETFSTERTPRACFVFGIPAV
jgi:hypothetical protein